MKTKCICITSLLLSSLSSIGIFAQTITIQRSPEVVRLQEPSSEQLDSCLKRSDEDLFMDPLVFSWKFYSSSYKDTQNLNQEEATQHWLHYGLIEGRRGTKGFHSVPYLQNNQDVLQMGIPVDLSDPSFVLKAIYQKAIKHYVCYGVYEKRNGQALDVATKMRQPLIKMRAVK